MMLLPCRFLDCHENRGSAGDLVGKLTGSAPLFRSEKLEEMRQIAWVCSSEKAHRDLGWVPRTHLEKAVDKTAVGTGNMAGFRWNVPRFSVP